MDEEMDERITTAANELREAVAMRLGELADRLLERPAFGTPEWHAWWEAKDTPQGDARRRDWHLAKLRIARTAGVDLTGDVLGAHSVGASWEDIGEVCGITRDAARERWSADVQRVHANWRPHGE